MGNASTARSDRFSVSQGVADNSNNNSNNTGNMENAGPGWYYDPDDEAIYRYWDGQAWTEHRSDMVLSEVPS